MTGRSLYDKHAKALHGTLRYRYVNGNGAVRTFDDRPGPRHWLWLADGEREYWNALAKLVTPKR